MAATTIEARVINLDRRPERLAAFCARYPASMPAPERFPGVDGARHAPAGVRFRGRWGCWEAHRGVLAQAVDLGVDSLLVFEDDAWPIAAAGELWAAFLDALPGDWQLTYLGGAIQGRARRVNRYVGAFERAVVLQSYLVRQPLLGELAAAVGAQPPGEPHVDNFVADLTKGRPGIYGSIPWLFWHDAGRSDNSGINYRDPFTWPDAGQLAGARYVPRPQPCDHDAAGRCRRPRCRRVGAKTCAVGAGLMLAEEQVEPGGPAAV